MSAASHFLGLIARAVAALGTAAALIVSLLVVGAAAPASAADASAEQQFTAKINEARAEAGLPALATRAGLVAVARNWAETMANQSKLYHNPNLAAQVRNYRWVGENVGYGPDSLTVHVAFMNSPGHRANILDRDYTQVGVGAVTVNGRVWVAEVFRRPMRVTAGATTFSSFEQRLTLGSTGSAVKRVQARLGVRSTGYYGRTTKAAVARYQKSLGWAGRGSVGRRTWSQLF